VLLLLVSKLKGKKAQKAIQASLGQETDAIDKLLSLLEDKGSFVRSSAASALGQLGKTSDPILPKVVQLLELNRDENVMGSSIDCLWSIVVE
jgi:HEAT repeat protein